jgi:hypothetical protein
MKRGMRAIPIPSDSPEYQEVDEALSKIRGILGEHFEACVFMCSREGDLGTSFHTMEMGNKFTIKGMLETYLDRNSEEEEGAY